MQAFTDVMLRSDGSVQEDTGDLTIERDSVRFHGGRGPVSLTDIQFVSIGRPPGLALGDWVKVEYAQALQASTVYFKGKGAEGGAKRIFSAMQHWPNSGQFECRVWVQRNHRFRLTLGSAPRKHTGASPP
jgi:hypothetical protein